MDSTNLAALPSLPALPPLPAATESEKAAKNQSTLIIMGAVSLVVLILIAYLIFKKK